MTDQKFSVRIDSKHSFFDLHIKETLQYKDLIFLFVKRDFTALYKQTILGPAWAIIQPLFTTVVFTIVFGNLAKLTTSDISGNYIIPAFLFYMAGNVCWSYFSNTVHTVANSFISNSAIMGKVYFPRLVTPISTALSQLISFSIQFCLLLIIWGYYVIYGGTSIRVTSMLILLPLVILQLILLSLGFGIIISSLTTKYRDLIHAIGFGLQLWQYASPVAYGLNMIPEKYQFAYLLNPVAPIITTFRYCLFGFGFFNIKYYIISWISTLLVFAVGIVLFSRVERIFMDTI